MFTSLQAMHLSASEIRLRTEEFYKDNDINLQLGKEVSELLWASHDHHVTM